MLTPHMPIAIVRLNDLTDAVAISRALLEGGLTALEFTLTNSAALQAVTQTRAALGDAVTVGVGTVLSAQHARESIAAGAEFLVTPIVRRDVIATGVKVEVPVACGAFTPTEIWDAWEAGAALVKVFPARSLGPGYIKDILAPLPTLKLVPTGGIDVENCAAYIQAGAFSVGIGSNLVDPKLIAAKNWAELSRRAAQYVAACQG